MKKVIVALCFTVCSYISFASHIVGGEMIYEYLGPGSQANTRLYRITLKLFRDQNTTGAIMPPNVYIGIFNNDNNAEFPSAQPFDINKSREDPVGVDPFPPCVNNATPLEYHVGYYPLTVELPNNTKGYTATYQTCCRVNPLRNVFNSSGVGGTGATYSCLIPPVNDNSPVFASSIDLLCAGRKFTLNFSATDVDKDSLVYFFCNSYNGGDATSANNINPQAPPYGSVDYINGFNSEEPLGGQITLNPSTGIISGVAPDPGKYVVCVCVTSYKKGVYVGTSRKDFIVNVGDCDFVGAQLDLKPVTCDGFSVSFSNGNTSPLNKTFNWDFGDPKSGADNFSTLPNPAHQFSDTGVFVYKLIVNKGDACSDSTTQTIKVYPGFFPGFISQGQCKNSPIQFRDNTKTKYGVVDSWTWDFGDSQTSSDTSHLRNPNYTYSQTNNYTVSLIVTSSKGCIDTASSIVIINDKPAFTITNDTLICVIDTLQLKSTGIGSFFWTPNYNLSNQNIASPLVSPDVPTKYYATFSDAFGCKGTDSVFVDVKPFVTLNAGNDTSICQGDAITLNAVSDGLYFKWTPGSTLNSDAVKNPSATPLSNTNYSLTALIGKCKATDDLNVKVTPYPQANAGNDSTICIGNSAQLHAAGGTLYKWSPALFLNDPNISNPLATPLNDIQYIVSVSDTLGCPKSVSDSVIIKVLNIIADAGPGDTSVVVNQPLQLTATGGEFYLWSPATGLSNTGVYNPLALLNENQQYVVKVSSAGCFDTDTINVFVYKIEPGLYVPNAFTPNNDGKNDVFRPIPVGMKSISYFRIFNRWGQLMFSTSENGKGWDGTFNSVPQDANVYVWMVEGIDYLGKKITKKGSVVLVR